MLEVMKKVNELLGVLAQRIDFYNRGVKETEAREATLNKQDAEVTGRLNDVIRREKALRPVEEVAAMKEEAIVLKHEADAILASVKAEKDAFNKMVSSTNAKLSEDTRKMAEDKAKIEREMAMVAKEWAEVRKEKATYKENILKELKAKIG